MLALVLIFQTPASVATVPTQAPVFDLERVARPAGGCGALQLGDDIVVCARLNLIPRLADLEDLEAVYGPKPFRPEVAVAGGHASARVEQRSVVSGQNAPALMFDFKLPFGRK